MIRSFQSRLLVVLAPLLVLALNTKIASAWGPQGHMMVAAVAWQDLEQENPQIAKKAREILESLPNRNDKSIETGISTSLPADRRDLFIFMKAATWPDIVRSHSNPQSKQHRPNWHFINLPFDQDGEHGPVPPLAVDLQNPDALANDSKSKLNIVQALKLNEAILADKNAPADRRAIALCWYLHLMGDLHQPLHATALFSKDFADGDHGGNASIVNDKGRQTALHPLWDHFPGTSSAPPTAFRRVGEWGQDKELSRKTLVEKLKVKEYGDWANESKQLAIDVVYRNGEIRPANDELLKDGQDITIPTLPAGYDDDAMEVVREQVFVAGFRLADKLVEILK